MSTKAEQLIERYLNEDTDTLTSRLPGMLRKKANDVLAHPRNYYNFATRERMKRDSDHNIYGQDTGLVAYDGETDKWDVDILQHDLERTPLPRGPKVFKEAQRYRLIARRRAQRR